MIPVKFISQLPKKEKRGGQSFFIVVPQRHKLPTAAVPGGRQDLKINCSQDLQISSHSSGKGLEMGFLYLEPNGYNNITCIIFYRRGRICFVLQQVRVMDIFIN